MSSQLVADPRPDWIIDQDWNSYSAEEHARWDFLFARQARVLKNRACDAFLEGLAKLRLSKSGIPHFGRLSDRLEALTDWRVVAVPGLLPDDVFFDHLANRRFPSGNFIRSADQLDYLQEPDIFHDVFGHVPMLAHPVFADYMQAYGRGGQRAGGLGVLQNLARLYWYTVEFGLIDTPDGLRIYGSGIVSSKAESAFCLEDPSPHRVRFDLERVMRTEYRIDDFQQTYFVIDSFDDLLETTMQDFAPIYRRLDGTSRVAIDHLIDDDDVITRGTQVYAAGRASSTSRPFQD